MIVPILRDLADKPSHHHHATAVAFLSLSSDSTDVSLARTKADPDFIYVHAVLDILLNGDEDSQLKPGAFILGNKDYKYEYHYSNLLVT